MRYRGPYSNNSNLPAPQKASAWQAGRRMNL